MTDVEFLVPDEPEPPIGNAPADPTAADPAAADSAARPPVDLRVVAGPLLLLAAAALAVAASFTDLYSVRQGSGSSRLELGIDGWGRYSTVPQTVIPHGLHGLRYGIALAPCALLLLIGCLLLAVEAVRPRTFAGLRRAVIPGACGVAGLLLGIGAAMGFDVQSRADQLDLPTTGDSGGQLSFGPSTWLALAAGVLAVAAVVLIVRADRPVGSPHLAG